MKLMRCPLNGERNISEFVCGGEVKAMPDPDKASDADWGRYLFFEDNPDGEIVEWWLHAPSSYWFIARRDTRTEAVLETMTVQEWRERQGTVGSGQAQGQSADSQAHGAQGTNG
ncbi:MAG: sarcosine oxidase subunit delta [Geminicoccaceae bacterium]|nr:sarcosine oxidase subunit delta [Geminicoccaceae bacterium]